MRKILFLFVFVFSSWSFYAQNLTYARQVLDTLCSPFLLGRGYGFGADQKACDYIENEMKSMNVLPFGEDYKQPFRLDVNIFDERMEVKIDKQPLTAGRDFVLDASSSADEGKYRVLWLNAEIINDAQKYADFLSQDLSRVYVAIDTTGVENQAFKANYRKFVWKNQLKAAGLISFVARPIFSISQKQADFVHIMMLDKFAKNKFSKIKVKIDARQAEDYQTNNLISYIKGEVDTFVVLTAHYDHVGTLGRDVFFPGAHDNASGCALVLDLMREFSMSKTKPHYGIAFMFFSGEEIGLLGSKYYVQNPVFDLKKIKFLVNLDLVGSGDEGVQIVNSTIFKEEYRLISDINEQCDCLPVIKTRGAAANSDHYFFYASGVPCFYIYSLGKYKEYHNIYDSRENLPFSAYDSIFKVLDKFITNMIGQDSQNPKKIK